MKNAPNKAFFIWQYFFIPMVTGLTVGCGAVKNFKIKNSHSPVAAETPSEDSPAAQDQKSAGQQVTTPDQSATPATANAPSSPTFCSLSQDQAQRPLATLYDIVRIINSLPKPTSISCLIEALPRPLQVSGSTSTISAQPAQGDLNPRIFMRINNLVLSIVPHGQPSEVLEVSEILNHLESIKGEIAFPVLDLLPDHAVLDRIRRVGEIEGTVCAGCHGLEQPAPQYPGKGFISRPLKQRPDTFVSLKKILELYKQCRQETTPRCEVFRSLFRFGEKTITELQFPEEMTTIF